jgi:hypothetical protein
MRPGFLSWPTWRSHQVNFCLSSSSSVSDGTFWKHCCLTWNSVHKSKKKWYYSSVKYWLDHLQIFRYRIHGLLIWPAFQSRSGQTGKCYNGNIFHHWTRTFDTCICYLYLNTEFQSGQCHGVTKRIIKVLYQYQNVLDYLLVSKYLHVNYDHQEAWPKTFRSGQLECEILTIHSVDKHNMNGTVGLHLFWGCADHILLYVNCIEKN